MLKTVDYIERKIDEEKLLATMNVPTRMFYDVISDTDREYFDIFTEENIEACGMGVGSEDVMRKHAATSIFCLKKLLEEEEGEGGSAESLAFLKRHLSEIDFGKLFMADTNFGKDFRLYEMKDVENGKRLGSFVSYGSVVPPNACSWIGEILENNGIQPKSGHARIITDDGVEMDMDADFNSADVDEPDLSLSRKLAVRDAETGKTLAVAKLESLPMPSPDEVSAFMNECAAPKIAKLTGSSPEFGERKRHRFRGYRPRTR